MTVPSHATHYIIKITAAMKKKAAPKPKKMKAAPKPKKKK